MNGRPVLGAPRLAALALASLVVAALLSAGLVAASTRPSVWIDKPLPGSTLLFGPTYVTVHAASPTGIAQVRFLVDGIPEGEVKAVTGDLVTVDWLWTPASAGQHLLTAIAEGTDGVPSDPASAGVTFVSRDQLPPQPSEAPPSLAPGQTPGPTSRPGSSSGPTPVPTPTKAPTPAPTVCYPPVALLILPTDFQKFYAPDTAPLFEWEYTSGQACIASQVLHIEGLTVNLEIPRGKNARSYQQPTLLPADPGGPQGCGLYHWYVWTFNADGDGDQSNAGSFDICPGPDG